MIHNCCTKHSPKAKVSPNAPSVKNWCKYRWEHPMRHLFAFHKSMCCWVNTSRIELSMAFLVTSEVLRLAILIALHIAPHPGFPFPLAPNLPTSKDHPFRTSAMREVISRLCAPLCHHRSAWLPEQVLWPAKPVPGVKPSFWSDKMKHNIGWINTARTDKTWHQIHTPPSNLNKLMDSQPPFVAPSKFLAKSGIPMQRLQ